MGSEGDVGDLVVVDLLTESGALVVSGAGESIAIGQREIEVRLLEGETHGGEEGGRAGGRGRDRGGVAPEIIRVVVAVEAAAEGGESIQVEAAMALFVGERGEPAAPEGCGELGPEQQGPGEILDRHQLMVGKAGEAESAGLGLRELAGPGQAVATAPHPKPRVTCRSLEGDRRPRRVDSEPSPHRVEGRRELRCEVARLEDPAAERVDVGNGGACVRGGSIGGGRHRLDDRRFQPPPGAGTCFKSARNVIQSGVMSAPNADPILEERARRIVETSIELAERGGFEAVRLRDVAAHAGVAMGTLYRRFRSKEDLLVAALEQETRTLAQRVRQRPPKGAEASERVVGFFEIATRGMVRRPNLSRAMLRATAAGEPVLAEKVEVFHDLMRQMIVGALRGAPVVGGASAISEREKRIGDLLDRVWFALMMSWAGGVLSPGKIGEEMRTSVELVLERSERAVIPQAGAMAGIVEQPET